MPELTVATCQFPVSADVARNGRYVMRQMRTAKERGADLVHFPEACLPGYAGTDFADHRGFDWELLRSVTRRVMTLAGELGLWTVVGSAHPLTGEHKPHNCLYVIDGSGRIADRYDKRFCAGDATERTGDLAHYTPGDHSSVFTVRGVRCGTLICHDYRYPELYRDLKRQDVQLVLHSFHAGNMTSRRVAAIRAEVGEELERLNPGGVFSHATVTQQATTTAQAGASHVWISCANSSARESCWGAFFVRADGMTTGRLPRNRAGVLVSTADTEEELYDSTAAWRDRAMSGVLHSGTAVEDPRSARRQEL
ncbi:carbon-nitrogen hydrolase family protein [Streptomyces ovatisporus]|uniref:Carbon-nitrogen hydrolase family protein n=1 Tax=Streptomyces ovatisporus TaxID=1128682 RepID=A0ABV9A3P8_9ACTN